MKLEVWTGPDPKEEEPTRVRVVRNDDGSVDFRIVDAEGDCILHGIIATLSNEGLHRYATFSREFGFPADGHGKICDI